MKKYTLVTISDIETLFQLQKASTGHAPGPAISETEPNKGNMGFIHAFVAAISVIIVSELGDKTFFIAAIMAMRYNRLTVLVGAMLALGLMTCLSGRWNLFVKFSEDSDKPHPTLSSETALFTFFLLKHLYEKKIVGENTPPKIRLLPYPTPSLDLVSNLGF